MVRYLKSFIIVLLVSILSYSSYADIYRVAKDKELWSAQFDNIQDAVKKCKSGADIIVIMDNEVYNERVEIDSAKGITITSFAYTENPGAIYYDELPSIQWQDKENFAPYTEAESKTNSSEFQRNGALAIMNSQDISIQGIIIDGEKEYPYESKNAIWEGKYKIFHGNTGIAIFLSARVTIRSCEIKNTYTGVYVVDRNPAGAYAAANPADNDVAKQIALSGVGKMGNHLFELNRIHDNSFGVGTEIMWGLGSTFKHNLVYDNYGKKKLDSYLGGAFRIKDHVVQPWLIYNNTFFRNETLIHMAYWRAGTNFLFASNIVGEAAAVYGKGVELTGQAVQMDMMKSVTSLYNNVWQPRKTPEAQSFYVQNVGNSDLMTPPIWIFYNIDLITPNMDTKNFEWDNVKAEFNGTEYDVEPQNAIFDSRIINVKIDNVEFDLSGRSNTLIVTNFKKQNSTTKQIHKDLFKSIDPADKEDFLMPNYDDKWVRTYVQDLGYENLGVIDADGSRADIGALCVLNNNGKNDWTGQSKLAKLKIIDGTFVNVDKNNVAKLIFPIEVINGTLEDFDADSIKFEKIDFYDDLPNLEPLDGAEKPKTTMPEPINLLSNIKSGSPTLGGNYLEVELTSKPATNSYGMFHVVISGVNKFGDKIYSNIGVFPFRNFTYKYTLNGDKVSSFTEIDIVPLDAKFEDKDGNEIDEIGVGETLWLHVTSEKSFTMDAGNFNLIAVTGDPISSQNGDKIIDKWSDADGKSIKFSDDGRMPFVFKKTGNQIISASGYDNSKQTAIGVSRVVKVTPATPNYVKFYDPGSSREEDGSDNGLIFTIPQKQTQTCKIDVYDVYGNLSTAIKEGEKYYIELKSDDDSKVTFASNKVLLDNNKGRITVDISTPGNIDDVVKVYARLEGKEWQDFSTIKIGQPLTVLKGEEKQSESYVGILVPVRVFVTEDGTTVSQEYVDNHSPIKISIDDLSQSNLKFYSDAEKTNEIVAGDFFELTDGDMIIYFTSTTVGPAKFSLKSEEKIRVTNINSVEFTRPPITSIFITWTNNQADLAENPIAISYKDGSFNLYSWGIDGLGNVSSVPVDWKGLGVFSGITENLSSSISVPIDELMKNQDGKFVAMYDKGDGSLLTDTTATIQIIGDVDRVFIIDASKYIEGTTTIADLPSLELIESDTTTWNLSDSVALISIGVDDTLGLMFPLRLEWSVIGANPDFNFLPDSSRANSYKFYLDIDDMDAAGKVKLSILTQDRNNNDISKSTNFIVIDPVTNINITLFYNLVKSKQEFVTIADNGSTISKELYLVNQPGKNYLMSASAWQKDDSTLVNCAINWTITGENIPDAPYNGLNVQNDTCLAQGLSGIDILTYTVSRNGISYSFKVEFVDAIEFGIMPSPLLTSMFKNNIPKIRAVLEGEVSDISATIFDQNGNFVKNISGVGTGGDFAVSNEQDSENDETGKVKIYSYESTKWDGTNMSGIPISTGSYIINFFITMKDGTYQSRNVNFYVIKDVK